MLLKGTYFTSKITIIKFTKKPNCFVTKSIDKNTITIKMSINEYLLIL